MNQPDASPFGTWSIRGRIAFVLATAVAYALVVFASLDNLAAGPIAVLSVVPAAAAGWLLGLRVGLLAGLIMSLSNVLLFGLTGTGWGAIIWGATAFVLSPVAGGVAGWLSELLNQVDLQSRELAREREAIKGEIEQHRRAEERLRQTEKLAAMGQLLAGVAHELNNLLTVIVGGADLLRTMVGSGPLREEAEEIAKAAERSARIVRNLLALSRQRPPERQPVSLNQIVREALELLTYALRADNVQVVFDLAPDLPVLSADPHQLQQVMVNLVTNAHHAMLQTPPPRRLRIATGHDPLQGKVTLDVGDTGPGIPAQILGQIFEPFFTTKPAGEGTGLGLSLCQGIIQGHRGTIRVESQPGPGATFRIELPMDTRHASEPEPVVTGARPLQRKTILVVDDEPAIAKMLTTVLSADGHRVETAANGAVALEKLQERAYDLILSDVKMPELDGPGLYREVERRYPGLKQRIVFITGDLLSPQTRAFLAETGAPHLSKPVAAEEIRRVVERVMPGSNAP